MAAMAWRTAVGFPQYEVSECGDLRRIKTGTRLQGHMTSDGYPAYKIKDGSNTPKEKSAHRLVIEAFVGPMPSPGMEVAHNDGSRLNAHWSNLRWGTRKSNSDDRIAHGTTCAGMANGRTNLCDQDVHDIRREYRKIKAPGSGRRVAELVERYGISHGAILDIAKGRTWRHLPFEALP